MPGEVRRAEAGSVATRQLYEALSGESDILEKYPATDSLYRQPALPSMMGGVARWSGRGVGDRQHGSAAVESEVAT